MPYLRITCPTLEPARRRAIAAGLTDELVRLFHSPVGRPTDAELRERCTVHFVTYADDELFVGGRTPRERGQVDLTVELSDWSLGARRQRRVARELTAALARWFAIPVENTEGINIRFHPYPARDFAVGGVLLADRVPRVARVMKRMAG